MTAETLGRTPIARSTSRSSVITRPTLPDTSRVRKIPVASQASVKSRPNCSHGIGTVAATPAIALVPQAQLVNRQISDETYNVVAPRGYVTKVGVRGAHTRVGPAALDQTVGVVIVGLVEGLAVRGTVVEAETAVHLNNCCRPGQPLVLTKYSDLKAPNVGDGAFRRLAQKVDLELLARLARADCRGRTGSFDCSAMDWFIERARALGVEHKPPAPILMGRHLIELGVDPGPRMGEILRAVYELQLDNVVTNLHDAQEHARGLIGNEDAEKRTKGTKRAEDTEKRTEDTEPTENTEPPK